jgi:carboxyl-terminal processing protease
VRAAGAKNAADTYLAIAHAIAELQDSHSFFKLPDNLDPYRKQVVQSEMWAEMAKTRGSTLSRGKSPFSPSREMTGHIDRRNGKAFAHVVVPQCLGQYTEERTNRPHYDEFPRRLNGIILELLVQKPDGWILDLRGNGGGNMWPMLAGIGMLLGEGDAGSFQQLGGSSSTWFYKEGKIILRDNGAESVQSEIPGRAAGITDAPWMAVLVDRGTGSPAELVAVSFFRPPPLALMRRACRRSFDREQRFFDA